MFPSAGNTPIAGDNHGPPAISKTLYGVGTGRRKKGLAELGFVRLRGYAVWYGMAGVWGAYPLLNSLSNDL
jgi:hypothetical protein